MLVSLLWLLRLLILLHIDPGLLHGLDIWACIIITCSRVSGGGFPALLFSLLLLLRVLTI
jgi:hypothetical protein